MKNRLLTLLLLVFCSGLSAQYTTMFNDTLRPFGGGAYSMDNIQEDDSFYYATGIFAGNLTGNQQQTFVLKIDRSGVMCKKKLLVDSINYYGEYFYNSMLLDKSRILQLVIKTETQNRDLGTLIAYNKYNLDTLWTKVYSHPDTIKSLQSGAIIFSVLTAIKATSDGGYILTGNYNKDCINGNVRSFLMKIDSVGNVEWRRTYSSFYTFFDIEIAPDSGYYVPSGFNGTNALQLVKFDNNGLYQWKVGVTSNSMAGYPMAISIQDSSHVILSFYHLHDVANYLTSVIATKVNVQTKSIVWEKDYYPYKNFECVSLHQAMGVETLSDGSIIISGTSARYGYDAVILKLNSNGDSLWCKSYDFHPDPYDCQLNDLIVCDDGGFMGVGFFDDQAGSGQTAWMFKTDKNGVVGFEASAPLSLQGVRVYPNPAQDYTIIEFQKPITEESTLLVYNSLGQKVKSLKLTKNQKHIRLDLLGLESGLYYFELLSNSEFIGSGKIVKE